MVSYPTLASLISSRSDASELHMLRVTPTAHAVVHQLAQRTGFLITAEISDIDIEMFLCSDTGAQAVSIPSPFMIAAISAKSSVGDYQLFRILDSVLQQHRVTDKPLVIITPSGTKQLGTGELHDMIVKHTNVKQFELPLHELINVLLTRPPRDGLIKRIIQATSLKLLNPYRYKGPIPSNMFFGREEQLHKLTQLNESYALVGPRAIGKTSLITRAAEELHELDSAAIHLECNSAINDTQMFEQLASRLVEDYFARPRVLHKLTVERLSRLIEFHAKGSANKRIAVFIDEADRIGEHCPQFTEFIQRHHNQGTARFVSLGLKN